ncbi:MAG: hypothetical protein I3273_04115 [Candidatus Moeniiplasma glomeromycotorum]|nr:hypothetical protein [Candidatus Moeniiplasma glomeromycotorum]
MEKFTTARFDCSKCGKFFVQGERVVQFFGNEPNVLVCEKCYQELENNEALNKMRWKLKINKKGENKK